MVRTVPSSCEPFCVYVVEDDPAVLKSLCALLQAYAYRAVPCRSAEEFLDLFDRSEKACVVLDLRLPGMSGMQLQKHLSSISVTIPIVVVTAHGDVPIAVEAMRAARSISSRNPPGPNNCSRR